MIRTVGIVSLSSGILGESFIRFESDIGIRRYRKGLQRNRNAEPCITTQ